MVVDRSDRSAGRRRARAGGGPGARRSVARHALGRLGDHRHDTRDLLPAGAGSIGALASTAEPDDGAGTVIVVDPGGAPHAPGQLVVADLSAAVAAALALPTPASRPAETADSPDVEIRLATNDRLVSPGTVAGAPAALSWRIIAPAGLTPVIEGGLTFALEAASVELAGCYLEGDVAAGSDLAALTLTSVTMNPRPDACSRSPTTRGPCGSPQHARTSDRSAPTCRRSASG